MTLNLFNQFKSPEILGLPTTILAIMMIIPLLHNKPHLLGNRLTTLLTWLTKTTSKTFTTTLTAKGQKWARLLTALFFLLLSSNLMGLLPYTMPPTALLSMNMALALPLWLGTVLTGLINKPTTALAHLLPEGSPNALSPALILIETTSLLMRPIALGVRLTANITAGHLLISMISLATINLTNLSTTLSMTTLTLLTALTLLEIAVACIQAYVFTLLLSLYLQENT
uniref:ATP synthase subunit a n=1 Tax=Rena humilis TaxID=711330 RepID=Q6I7Y2_RENHU|nr:ATP synthase F0 subunit 6 [Rena humilis]BAD24742.1 ATPase subunit 6 [Rena humilis]